MDPKMIIPWDMLNSFIFGLKDIIHKYPMQSQQRWNVMFATYVPTIDYKSHPELITVIEKIEQWVQEYPQVIKLCTINSEKHYLELDRKFLC